MELKYLNSIYKGLINLPINFIKLFLMIPIYIILNNFFIQNEVIKIQILYIFPIFFIYCLRNINKFQINWNILFFFIGIIDDIILNKIPGTSSLYYLIVFNIFLMIIKKFADKDIIFYIMIIFLLIIHYTFLSLSSLYFVKLNLISAFNFENLQINEVFMLQLPFLALNFLIILLYILISKKKYKNPYE